MRIYKPHEEPPPVPYDPNELRPDQKRCPRCRGVVILEQQRCPYCGKRPWLWSPNFRFLIVSVIIGIFLLLLLPLMTKTEKPDTTRFTNAP